MGALLTERIKSICSEGVSEKTEIIAVGTNSAATAAMLKAGADNGATGENACIVCAARADIIAGPIGIVIADSLLGEITERMAAAVGRSRAKRVLIPVNKCDNIIAGMKDVGMSELVRDAAERIKELMG